MPYLDSPERLQRIREMYLEKLLKPELTAERARIVTESYRKNLKEPAIIRRAKALADILRDMTVYIQPWELLAGNLGPEPVSAPLYPEGGVDFVLAELDTYGSRPGDKFHVSEGTARELREILPWWEGRTLKEYGLNLMPSAPIRMREAGVFGAENMLTCGTGHFLPDYARILREGFSGVRRDAEDQLAAIDPVTAGEYERKLFYEAVLIICDAVALFAKRYADLARRMAEDEPDAERRGELEAIAERCRRVPMEPAKGFADALQSLWFTHVICYIDSNGYGVTLGRSAAYLAPFYARSLESGEIDRAGVLSLISSFYFKCNDILKLYNNTAAKNYGGFPVGQPIQLGGIGPDGGDDTNELSRLFLEAERRVRLYQPDIGILWTERMSDEFLREAVSLVATNSKPKFFNYHVGSEMYREAGLSEEEARNEWAFIGCVEFGVPGKSWTWADAAMFNLPKVLELALNDGVDPATGERLGPATGTAEELGSFEALRGAFRTQIDAAFRKTVQGITALQIAHRDLWPEPYESILVQGCMDRGQDVNAGGARYYQTGVQFVGLATTIDSLMALKTHVYDRGEITLPGLVKILREDFRDCEVLRQRLQNETLRFGNEIEEVNGVASDLFSFCCDTAAAYRDIWGGLYTASFYTLTAHVGFGKQVGATPDGRRAGAPLSDASSPAQGAAKGGATEILSTQAKLPHRKAVNGTLLNMKFNKRLISGEEGVRNLAAMIAAYFRMGGFHVQFNVVDAEVLRDAQRHPERYPDFLIRVAAYVTNWNQLSREVQDEIIARTEMEAF